MASSYPGALDSLSTSNVDGTTSATTHPALHNDANDAINKIETELGVNPSASFTDVVTRLNQITTVRKTADQNFTTTTLANVTDLVFPVVIGASYKFEFFVVWSAAGAGITQQFAVTFPTVTYGLYFSESPNVTAVQADAAANATDAITAGVTAASGTKVGGIGGTNIPAANAKTITRITGILQNVTAAGNIQLQAATETATTSTCFAGSHGLLWTN
jgi:hypothetical protein